MDDRGSLEFKRIEIEDFSQRDTDVGRSVKRVIYNGT